MHTGRPLLPAFAGLFILVVAALSQTGSSGEQIAVIGYFPNVTHAHALIAQNMAAEGNGWFERYLPGVTVKWQPFNAGPSAMESLFAKSIDLTYVGPNPVLNAFIRSRGGVAVVSGAVRGGAGLVVPADSVLVSPADFRGKRIATPQLGNTQDIACRSWLIEGGLKMTMTGGDAMIVPTANPIILQLFATGGVDAAWTVEPWVSRLELETGGKVVYSEPKKTSLTTVLAMGERFLRDDPELAAALVEAHRELTEWIKANPGEAMQRVCDELTRQTRREFPFAIVERAWPRLVFDNGISVGNFEFSFNAARDAGFLKGEPDLSGLVRQ